MKNLIKNQIKNQTPQGDKQRRMQPSTPKINYFTDLYNKARDNYSAALAKYDNNKTQYRTGKVADGAKNTPVVRNITYELVEAEISTDIPRPRVNPLVHSNTNAANAAAVEALCRAVRDNLPFEALNDLDERLTYVLGGSVWLAEWDNSEHMPKVSCISPENFIPEPGITDISAMNYCFIVTARSREDILESFGRSVDCDPDMTPQVVICYWKNGDGRICRYIFCDKTELADDENIYMRRGRDGQALEFEKTEAIKTSAGMIPKGKIRAYVPDRFPIVVRRNITKDGELFGQSDCEIIRSQQDAVNRIESRIYQKLIRSAVMPYMPEDCRITPTNSVFGEVVHVDSQDSAAKFGVIDTTPDIKQDIEQSDRLYNHARRLLGITDSFTGDTEGGTMSGYAFSLRVSQSAGRLRSRRVMKNALYADLDRVIFGLYLAFCDERLPLGFTDSFGVRHELGFSKYDFVRYDERMGEWYYDDRYLFSVDKSVSSDSQNSEALWTATLEFYRDGLFGTPESARARRLCWARLDELGYPGAHGMSKVFENENNRTAKMTRNRQKTVKGR